jgi:hypothetical protein
VVLVVDALLHRLCLFKAIADVVEEGQALLHLLGNRCDVGLTGLIGADGRGVLGIDHTKRSTLPMAANEATAGDGRR